MPLRHRTLQKSGTFFITTSTYNKIRRFKSSKDYEIVLEKIEAYRLRDNAKIHGYVVMPNHLHLLLTIPESHSISSFMRDLKKRIAYEYLIENKLETQKLWQLRFDDVHIISEEIFAVKLNYIHYNPVKAGLVNEPRDWRYSSAGFYENGKQHIVWVEHLAL